MAASLLLIEIILGRLRVVPNSLTPTNDAWIMQRCIMICINTLVDLNKLAGESPRLWSASMGTMQTACLVLAMAVPSVS